MVLNLKNTDLVKNKADQLPFFESYLWPFTEKQKKTNMLRGFHKRFKTRLRAMILSKYAGGQ